MSVFVITIIITVKFHVNPKETRFSLTHELTVQQLTIFTMQYKLPSLLLDSDFSAFSSNPSALSKFFSIFFTLSLSLFTAPARSGKPPSETFPLNQAISQLYAYVQSSNQLIKTHRITKYSAFTHKTENSTKHIKQ